MKKGYTSLNLQLPKRIKDFYEKRARQSMVSVSAVIRAVLLENAECEAGKENKTPVSGK
jgi:hypothetical protein